MRKQLLDFDNVLSKQREVIYSLRNKILEGKDITDEIFSWFEDIIDMRIFQYLEGSNPARWNVTGYIQWLERATEEKFNTGLEEFMSLSKEKIGQLTAEHIKNAWDKRIREVGEEEFKNLVRFIALRVIDNRWKEHLYEIDRLKEGIGLRGYAQKDPVIEYKKESLSMFEAMLDGIYFPHKSWKFSQKTKADS